MSSFIQYSSFFNRSVSVVAPSMAVPGRTTPVLVTLQERRDAVKVTLRLLEGYNTNDQQRILAENTTILTGKSKQNFIMYIFIKYYLLLMFKRF